jgi:hypothetical protein
MRDAGFKAMTANERLSAAGLVNAFDAAARKRARAEMIALLQRVDLSEHQAFETTDTILAFADRYGY